MFSLMTLVGML